MTSHITAHSPTQKIAILRSVVDWLEANPRHAITGKMALSFLGEPCDPKAVTATCFCFLGRLIHDTGIASERVVFNGFALKIDNVVTYLEDIGASAVEFAEINDGYLEPASRFAALRKYIDELEEGIAA